jgi:hypothetical protein
MISRGPDCVGMGAGAPQGERNFDDTQPEPM